MLLAAMQKWPSPPTGTFHLPACLGGQSKDKGGSLTHPIQQEKKKLSANNSQGFIASKHKAARCPARYLSQLDMEAGDVRESWCSSLQTVYMSLGFPFTQQPSTDLAKANAA